MKEIDIQEGERVNILHCQSNATDGDRTVYRLKEGARVDFVFLGLPKDTGISTSSAKKESVNMKSDFSFLLDGAGATLNFFGFIYGRDNAVFDIKTESGCLKRGCTVNFLVRSALFDRSRVNFCGDMVIEKNGHESDCYLSHKTLLLSDHSRTKTIPALEIKANDVKAGHAATIGKIDNEDLFYLNSRGINDKMATEMLIKGYFESLMEKISDTDIREKATSLLYKYL